MMNCIIVSLVFILNPVILRAQTTEAAVDYSISPNLKSYYVSNCGFNAVSTALFLSGKEANVERIVSEARFGAHFEKAISLGDIARILASENLHSAGIRFETVTELLVILQKSTSLSLAIVQTKTISEQNHFVVVCCAPGKQFTIYDYPKITAGMSIEAVDTQLVSMCTGYALLVGDQSIETAPNATQNERVIVRPEGEKVKSQLDARPLRTAVRDAESIQGKLIKVQKTLLSNEIPEHVEVVDVPLEISNIGESPLLIKEFKGSCSCFVGASQKSLLIPASQSATIELSFNRKQFVQNKTAKVAILSSDPTLPEAIITCQANSQRISQRRIAVIPQSVDYGRCNENIVGKQVRVEIFVARALNGTPLNITSIDYNEKMLDVTTVPSADQQFFGTNWQIYTLYVVWKKQPLGVCDQLVKVHTDDLFEKELDISLDGNFEKLQ